MKNEYNWLWYILATFWAGMEAYWCGLSIEKTYPLSVCLPMVVISACIGLGFLFAFFESKKEKIK
jgi:hypothetical protein